MANCGPLSLYGDEWPDEIVAQVDLDQGSTVQMISIEMPVNWPRPPTYRPYIAWGRRQFRLGWVKRRQDRWCDEYHYIAIEWQL